MMDVKCSTCNTTFQDNCSLKLHYHYTHSNNPDKESETREPDVDDSTENNNNNFYKFKNNCPASSESATMTAISPGMVHSSGNETNRDANFSSLPPHNVNLHRNLVNSSYDLNHVPGQVSHSYADANYMLGAEEFARHSPHSSIISTQANSTTSPVNVYSFANDQRYHPYYKSGFRDPRGQMPVSILPPPHLTNASLRCDKCDFICSSPDVLHHHGSVAHGVGMFNAARFNNGSGAEPQAEILDLDSHKVHVYQPPNGQDSHDSEHQSSASLDPWMQDAAEKKYYPQMHLSQNGATNGGRGGTPLASPDFGNVSTTTDNVENLQTSMHSPFHSAGQFDQNNSSTASANSAGSAASQITSSDGPHHGKGKSAKSGNGSWKSNEPRRPKTYNCSACNKWFTSSGHLKRHYNTTLHKNAVKQSGAPDPATLPISAHHHPHKDPTYVPSSRQMKNSPSTSTESTSSSEAPPPSGLKLTDRPSFPNRTTPSQQISPVNSFLHNSPNLMAGPSEIPGGLLHPRPSYTNQCGTPPELIKSPSPISAAALLHSNHTNYLPFTTVQVQPPPPPSIPFFQQPTPQTLYPNFRSPHVSTQVIKTTSHTGEDGLALDSVLQQEDQQFESAHSKLQESLPSFACIQKNNMMDNGVNGAGNLWNYTQYFGLDHFISTLNVGGTKNSINDNTIAVTPTQMTTAPSINDSSLTEDDSYSSDLFSTGAVESKNFVKQERDSPTLDMEMQSFDLVPDTKDVVRVKQEDSLYDDENTTVSSSTVDSILPVSSPIVCKRKFLCEKCHKAFNKACYLTQHNKSFHSGYKPFKCARCGKRFTEAKQYQDHADKHAGDKPHKCLICPKQFNHKTDLRRHVCLHTNIRPHICDLCHKGFIRRDHMLKHRETHSNKKQSVRHVRIPKIKKEDIMELQILC